MTGILRTIILLACMALLFPQGSQGQEEVTVERGELRRLTTNDGLPQGLVRDILQDRQGYLWFSTKDGLARSDGYKMSVFRHSNADSTSLSGDHTTYLLEDSAGFLWVGVKGKGVDRFDPRSARFQPARPGPGITRAHVADVQQLEQGASGRIWTVSVEEKLAVIVSDDAGTTTMRRPEDLHPGVPFLPTVNAVACDGHGGLWMVGRDTLRWVDLSAADPRPTRNWTVPKPTPDAGGRFRHHELLTWPGREQLLVILGTSVVFFDTRYRTAIDTLSTPAAHAVHIPGVVDREGNLWYEDKHNRSCRLSLTNGRVTLMDLRSSGADAKSELGLTGFRCQDNMGNLWAGTGGLGALKLNWSSRRFSNWAVRTTGGKDVVEYVVLGHRQFGLFASDVPGRMLQADEHDRGTCFGCDHGGTWWDGAAHDPSGRIWGIREPGGTQPPELGRSNVDGTVVSVQLGLEGMFPLRAFPGQGATIWIFAGPGRDDWRVSTELVQFDTRTEQVTGRFTLPRPLNRREYWSVAQWSLAPNGSIWMATIEGVLHFDPDLRAFREFRHDPADSTSLPTNMIFALCPDPKEPGHVWWVGTEGGGLARLDTRTGRCERFDTRKGLPNNVIYGVLPAADGDLYLSTNVGLVRYDPATGTSLLFTAEDGLPGNEFNRYGSALGPDGRMYFEGMEGGVMFDPAALKEVRGGSRTCITGVAGMNSDLPVIIAEGLVWTPEGKRQELKLPFDTRMITVRFSVMDHTAPAKNQYRYRMSGLHDEWVENGTRDQATFTNLDPGRYTFLVQGRNSAGAWDEVGATMELVITPPWWGTWWFRTLLVLAMAGLLYAFYRYRLARALEVVRVRDRIARDLHDEIGSTLSSVSLFSSVAQKKAAGKAPEASELLGRITESTTQVLEAMNDIVWAVNADNDDMASVIKRMHAFAVSVTEARGCKLHLHADDELKSGRLGMTQRKNLYLIFKEAVNNAVKYSGCANLRVELQRDKAAIALRVTDDGMGFDPKAHNASVGGGNGIGNMRNRAAEIPGTLTITSAPGKGTTVELRFLPGKNKRSLEPMTSSGDQPR